MEFNDLLRKEGIDPEQVVVLRHRPTEPRLREALPLLSLHRPDLYNAYQRSHGERVEASLRSTQYVASCVGLHPGEALFIGLFRNKGSRPITFAQYWGMKAHQELRDDYGMRGFSGDRKSLLWFDLELTDFYWAWSGRLVVRWTEPERAWSRRAHRNTFDILSLHEEDLRHPPMPSWNELIWSWDRLHLLSSKERDRLSQWRGIYYIFDTEASMGYVGSAGGAENLLGRWTNYKASGDGGNKLLKKRDPKNFLFSILQVVPPDLPMEELVKAESNWKDRLHTREPYGLNAN